MKIEPSVGHELFRGKDPSSANTEVLLAQYRLLVETFETLVARHQGANAFFVSVNSVVLAAGGFLLRDGALSELETRALIILSLGGFGLCLVWLSLIFSFRQHSVGKFKVIHELEEWLPARVFTAEWATLGRGEDPTKYRPFTRTEMIIPVVFAALHLVFVGAVWL